MVHSQPLPNTYTPATYHLPVHVLDTTEDTNISFNAPKLGPPGCWDHDRSSNGVWVYTLPRVKTSSVVFRFLKCVRIILSYSVNQDSNFKIRAVRRDMISALEEARQKISLLALAVAARATWMGAERQ